MPQCARQPPDRPPDFINRCDYVGHMAMFSLQHMSQDVFYQVIVAIASFPETWLISLRPSQNGRHFADDILDTYSYMNIVYFDYDLNKFCFQWKSIYSDNGLAQTPPILYTRGVWAWRRTYTMYIHWHISEYRTRPRPVNVACCLPHKKTQPDSQGLSE